MSGKIVVSKPGFIILNTGSVGYKIFVNNIEANNEKCELFIHQHLREDADDLYGFKNFPELEIFEKLISVNGVGPKVAMAIMTISASEKIIEAIISENISFFQAIPGIGKKVAAKIILDLKSKVSNLSGENIIAKINSEDDVSDALISLGFKKQEISKVLAHVPAKIKNSEEKINWCLRNITK